MKLKDKRISLMHQVLSGIKVNITQKNGEM